MGGTRERQPHIDVSLPFSLPSPLSKNKYIKSFKKKQDAGAEKSNTSYRNKIPKDFLFLPQVFTLHKYSESRKPDTNFPRGSGLPHKLLERTLENYLMILISKEGEVELVIVISELL